MISCDYIATHANQLRGSQLTWCLQHEPSPAEEPDGSSSRKARSKRGVSKISVGRNAHWHITEFNEFGDPLSPPIALTKYKTIIGLLVRDFIPIRYRKWIGKDDDLWRVPES